MQILNTNAKQQYYYNFYWYRDINREKIYDILREMATDKIYHKIKKGVKANPLTERTPRATVGKGKYCKTYLKVPCGFDIETTTTYEKDENDKIIKSFATMYVWQLSLGTTVIMSNNWYDFIELLSIIKEYYNPTDNMRLIVFVHNLSYEIAFLRSWLNITDSFLKEQRKFVQVTHDGFFMFRDTMAMNNSSLKKLASDYCNTQKCAGDLDYNIQRSSNDAYNLTAKELSYCHNDVLILSEYFNYYYNEYLVNNFAPLTITATLRNEIKENIPNLKNIMPKLQMLMPTNEDFYNFVFYDVYRGGYSHANEYIIGQQFSENDNIVGFDFTSSYPACMFDYFPSGKFLHCVKPDINTILKYKDKYCLLIDITFQNITSVNGHSLESRHKTIELKNAVIDNGHVKTADVMRVGLTELDFNNYLDFYKWGNCTVHNMWYATRGDMPKEFITPMIKYYKAKHHNKINGIPYAIEKSKVNSFYGMFCTRKPTESIKYDNDGWTFDAPQPYEKWLANQFLCPYYGVWISAHARRRLMATVKKLECNPNNYTPAIYCDTDSIKILNFDDYCKKVIEDYNNNIREFMRPKFIKYNLDEAFDDLGMFDLEYGITANTVIAFKTLGSKRYLISYRDSKGLHHNQTIAGLPKGILFEMYDYKKAYDVFEDGLKINMCKLTAIYNDEENTEIINGCTQYEKSNVALVPINFSMSLDKLWLETLKDYGLLDKKGYC